MEFVVFNHLPSRTQLVQLLFRFFRQILNTPHSAKTLLSLSSFTSLFSFTQTPDETTYGFKRLLELLQLSPTLTDVHFIEPGEPYWRCREPIPLAVLPAHSGPAWWPNISSIYISLAWTREKWFLLRSMLVHFDKLKSLSLKLDPSTTENELADEGSTNDLTVLLRPLDSLHLEIEAKTLASDLELEAKILSSWLNVKRLSFNITTQRFGLELLETVSDNFFGSRFSLNKFIPESWRLEEFKLCLNEHLRSEKWNTLADVPQAEIPRAAWMSPEALQNLKLLTLDCYARLKLDSFATIVFSMPLMEHFRADAGLAGLRPTDLFAVSCWKRLRTCHLTLDIKKEDLASPPSSMRKFIQLNMPGFVPHLVQDWREKLESLELIEVSCRVVIEDEYVSDDGY